MLHYIVQVQAFNKEGQEVKKFSTIMFPHESEESRCEAALKSLYGMTKGITYHTSKLTILKTEGNPLQKIQQEMAKKNQQANAPAQKTYTVAINKGQKDGFFKYYKFDAAPTEEDVLARLLEEGIEVDPKKQNLIFYETTEGQVIIEDAEIISETSNDPKEQQVESVEAVEEKPKEETKIEATLPAVPVVFNVDYKGGDIKEHSLARVNELDKQLIDLLKQVNQDTYEDKELWEKIDRVRLDAKDQRTKLDSYIKVALKPVKDFVDSVNSKVKEIGTAAKAVETKAAEEIEKRDNWLEEQERIAQEAKTKLAEERKEKLRDLDGKYNIDNEVFMFSYDAGIVISLDDIFDLSEEEFEAELALVKASYDAEQQRLADEKEAAEKAVNDAKKAKDELVSLRKMILVSGGYQEVNGEYTKNGYVVSLEQLTDLSNEEFIQLTVQHNTPKPEIKEDEPNPMQAVATPDDIELPDPVAYEPAPEEKENPENPPVASDPLGQVVSGMVAKHEEHQDQVNDVRRVVIEFSKDMPYFDVAMGKSILRITHDDFEDESLANVDAEKEVIAKAYKEEFNLVVMAIGQPKKK